MPNPKTPRTDTTAARAEITAEMAAITVALPGSIVIRHTRCGKPTCACHTDIARRHGPYISWTRAVNGKTVTRILTPDQLERYQPWFDNARRLRELTRTLETLSLQTFDTNEQPPQPRPPTPKKPPTKPAKPGLRGPNKPPTHTTQPRTRRSQP